MKYSTKIKLITTLLTTTSLFIGYWFGLSTNNIFNNDFSLDQDSIITNNIELIDAKKQIKNLKDELSHVSSLEYSSDNNKLQAPTINYTANEDDHEYISQVKKTTTDILYDIRNTKEVWSDEKQFKNRPLHEQNNHQQAQHAIEGITLAINQHSIPNTSISDVQCESSMCTAKFTHQDKSGHSSLLQHLTNIKQFSRGFVLKTDEYENQQKTIVYFPYSREFLPL